MMKVNRETEALSALIDDLNRGRNTPAENSTTRLLRTLKTFGEVGPVPPMPERPVTKPLGRKGRWLPWLAVPVAAAILGISPWLFPGDPLAAATKALAAGPGAAVSARVTESDTNALGKIMPFRSWTVTNYGDGRYSLSFSSQKTAPVGIGRTVVSNGRWLWNPGWHPAFPDPYRGFWDLSSFILWLKDNGTETGPTRIIFHQSPALRLEIKTSTGNWQVILNSYTHLPEEIKTPMVNALGEIFSFSDWRTVRRAPAAVSPPPPGRSLPAPTGLHLDPWHVRWGREVNGISFWGLSKGAGAALLVTGRLPAWGNGTYSGEQVASGQLLVQAGLTNLPEAFYQGLPAPLPPFEMAGYTAVRLVRPAGDTELIVDEPAATATKLLGKILGVSLVPQSHRFSPRVTLAINREQVLSEQAQTDAGHQPYLTDAASVAAQWVSGVEHLTNEQVYLPGQCPVIWQTIDEAVVKSPAPTIARIYLRRLIRPDSSGIWTVVGYDLRTN